MFAPYVMPKEVFQDNCINLFRSDNIPVPSDHTYVNSSHTAVAIQRTDLHGLQFQYYALYP